MNFLFQMKLILNKGELSLNFFLNFGGGEEREEYVTKGHHYGVLGSYISL
jgi:hypothetical protein